EKFRVGSHFTISHTVANAARTDAGGQQGVITSAMKMSPVLPVYENEELGIYTQVNNTGIPYPNPVATSLEMVRESKSVRLLADVFGEWEIIPDLKAKVSFGT